jgi:hypothetical protein
MAFVETSYLALRAVGGPGTNGWWAAARRRADAPDAVAALLHGRTRIELSAEEADAALAWAATVDGWTGAEPKPLLVHRTAA